MKVPAFVVFAPKMDVDPKERVALYTKLRCFDIFDARFSEICMCTNISFEFCVNLTVLTT